MECCPEHRAPYFRWDMHTASDVGIDSVRPGLNGKHLAISKGNMSSTCSNCGKTGHFFRECREPITSLGIIAFRRPAAAGVIQWLLIRRRVSIGYIEIMRGKYEPRDVTGIQVLVDQATVSERQRLLTGSFPNLWRELWNGPITRRYNQEYEQARAKFEVIRDRGALASCCRLSTTTWVEPEWGFPKGRRSTMETELTCALRETEEEAGVDRADLRVLEGAPIAEEYRGSNGINYRHRYWIAEAPSDPRRAHGPRECGPGP
jgi:ADP-ribose pyrophosphatase YjhB (NUDIX family)